MISVEMECFSPPGLAVRREREMPGVPPSRASRGREASPWRQLCWGVVPLTSLGPRAPLRGWLPWHHACAHTGPCFSRSQSHLLSGMRSLAVLLSG